MSLLNIFLIAISLSFDAMAVAAAYGAMVSKIKISKAIKIAFFFGFFQMLMPIIGWLIGSGLEKFITSFDHWVAFFLLTAIGVKMIIESFKIEKEKQADITSLKILLLLAIATSIDALVVGITFALIVMNIWLASAIIGAITFTLSLLAVYMGKKFGDLIGKKAELIGGLILIGIGVKILLEHAL
ncbi:MAG: manganese efflux pump MntP family protein [Patescibacteria group bacterium]|jgi:putative Mn2+ efflux pump MntP